MKEDMFFMRDKIDKLNELESFDAGSKLVYEWVKSNHINHRQYQELIKYLIRTYLHEFK